ncbi:hybrid sensor histidine kinase/response regulator [Sphingomonas colocasiae]|uniref:histidine kinase n=1 Tax=Sphingomonas colocasiae TaxID=1848973 RepID=A0ABS7PR73_9SPHN|nr:hybrid sensor histidine kinase/response regulator [Sphingomonas colocasiae]MBY8823842.1 hybrid sensor histidine kinase/response regulator [Sphingomonas colocasiae]
MSAASTAISAHDEPISEREVLIEQVRIVYRTVGRAGWTMMFLSIFVAAVLHDQGLPILIWLAVQIALKLATFAEMRWFFSEDSIERNPEGMARRLILSQMPHAAGWASLIWLVAPHATPGEIPFVMVILAGAVSGGVTTYGALPRVHAAYIATFALVQLMTFIYLRAIPGDDPYIQYAPLLSIVFGIGIFMNTRIAGQSYRQSILLRFTNAQLVHRLEKEVRSAEAADAAKSTFLAAASHDLRQPIHALGLFLALLDGSRLNAAQRETLGLARSALRASSEMLDALLDFSRAEAGVIVPRPRTFPINEALRQVEEEIGITADEKKLFYRTRDCDAMVEADPGLVKIILHNLVSNAIRYTTTGGVLIGCRRRGARIMVEVWDSGEGIPADQREAIFSDFVQLGNPERDHRKGLGLGLAIARRLARLIGSEITLASIEGRGSVFRFALPLAPADADGIAGGAPSEPGRALAGGTARSPAHILVIDDDETIRIGLGALLRHAGYSVDTVETIAEGQDSARKHVPDLLICDLRLRAGEDGAEAIRLLRAQSGRRIGALLITGETHPARIAEAAREDIEILYKPTPPDRLLEAIVRELSR